MRAIQLTAFGYDNLEQVERDDPRPGEGEVVVAVKAASLNYRDVLTVAGLYNPKLKLPVIPLSDGAGEVVAVGLGVTRVKLGDRVMGNFCQKWISRPVPRSNEVLKQTLGGPLDGMLATQVKLPAEGVVKTPAHLSHVQAATLPCAALTAWSALFREWSLSPADVLVVQGTGGVSLFALQFAVCAGARVIVTSSSDEKLARAKALGAHALINYKTTPEWAKEVRRLTDGIGADHVIEVGGAGTMPQSIRAVRPGGQISVIGILAGAGGELSLTPVLMQNIRLQGVIVGPRDDFEAMNRALELHQIEPIVDRVVPWRQAAQALREMADGKHFGKIVLDLDQS